MRNRNKAGDMVGTIPRKYRWLAKNDMHPPVPLWKL